MKDETRILIERLTQKDGLKSESSSLIILEMSLRIYSLSPGTLWGSTFLHSEKSQLKNNNNLLWLSRRTWNWVRNSPSGNPLGRIFGHFTIWSAVGMLRWFTFYSVINFIPLWEPISLISQNVHERQFLNSFVNRVHHSNDLPDQEHHTSRQCGKVRQVPMAVGLFCLTFIPLCLNHKFSPMLEPDIAMTDP